MADTHYCMSGRENGILRTGGGVVCPVLIDTVEELVLHNHIVCGSYLMGLWL